MRLIMIKKIFIALILTVSFSCSSVKKTQEAINYGNYDQAIQIAVNQLRDHKSKKGNQEYILLLEDAFKKATLKDTEHIAFLKKEGNPANLEPIYNLYLNLKNRQELIKPLLPLNIIKNGKVAQFTFVDYTTNIIDAKNKLTEYLYVNAKKILNTATHKEDYRIAYDDLMYLNKIHPNFKDVHQLLNQAHEKGINYIFVGLRNTSDKVLPIRLEADLLNFSTFNLNNLWAVYHTNKLATIQYDYEIEINFREIRISPEQLKEKELIKEKQVVDGWKYAIDQNGATVKDSLGKPIKVDKYKTIICKVEEITQFKNVEVVGEIAYYNLITKQLVNKFPLASEFIFTHKYATFSGDKNALDQEQLNLVSYKYIPFPSNEQMIYDTGEDLKAKIKNIVQQQPIYN